MFEWLKRIFIGEPEKKYNANIKGWLLTKSDRINARLEKRAKIIKTQNSMVYVKDVNKFVKDIQIMIAQELTYQKYCEEHKKRTHHSRKTR